ncbi:MAG: putative sigma-54 modulation protein [Arenicella sp.]|jgi:putative sigma-54 modulation protein
MQIVIHSNDFPLTSALYLFIRRHAKKSMRACSDQVDRVVVRLKDVNGPKGGEDKECCVEVRLASFAPIVVSKRSSDAYASISQALGRASRTTLRQLAKRRDWQAAQVMTQREEVFEQQEIT